MIEPPGTSAQVPCTPCFPCQDSMKLPGRHFHGLTREVAQSILIILRPSGISQSLRPRLTLRMRSIDSAHA